MATDQQKTPPRIPRDQTGGQESDRGATTQVGQVIQELGRLTRRLPAARTRRLRHGGRGGPPPSREQLVGLIDALGNPQHPDHAGAVDALVDLGPVVVPALNDALGSARSWLTAYRAAEALGRICDGRATGPLIQALQHPNSNVRWSAVRALAQIGDVRALLELRRMAQDDHGRTSWGESVSGAAQSALDQISAASVWGQSVELIKTAFTSVLMILSLILAFSVVSTLRGELDLVGQPPPAGSLINVRTPLPLPTLPPAPAAAPGGEGVDQAPTAAPTFAVPTATLQPPSVTGPLVITGTVLQDANVRPFPGTDNQPIGRVSQGDEVVFLSRTPDGFWYRLQLGNRRGDGSSIGSPDGSGWVNSALISPPGGELPVEEVVIPTREPPPTSAPLPTASP